jgi:KamA family protein
MQLRIFTKDQLADIRPLASLPSAQLFAMRVVASVLPFRVNQYVIDHLIDWTDPSSDPIFQLTFPQAGMLEPAHFSSMAALLLRGAGSAAVRELAATIRAELNPHPAGQRDLNVPEADPELQGIQQQYRETVLFFPARGQTCHAYCTFCFRWPQFVGDPALLMAAREAEELRTYLAAHPEVTDLLVTGGDPLVMKTAHLASFLEPLLGPRFEHLQNVRIGTKALSFWPFRFLTDPDADDLLRLFEKLVLAGKHVALMAHFNHWRELESEPVKEAVQRLRSAGVVLRTQAPLLAHINDDAGVWARMWRTQVRLGMVPYYMFVVRDTGARRYFEVPLARACSIYGEAIRQVSGLARTAHGPVLSTSPGKIEVQGVAQLAGEQLFVLRFLQGRNPDWAMRPFFARYDPQATWFDQLRPAGEDRFFFADEYERMCAAKLGGRGERLDSQGIFARR